MRAFLAALHFLTVLPVPGQHYLRDEDWGKATAWYAAVGLVLGALLVALDWVFRRIWPESVASALVLVAWVLLTGALHLDGFIDCCDGLLASVSRERRLEILRDIHAGAFGIVGVVLLLMIKYLALVDLPDVVRLPTLLLVPTLGRWGMTGAVLLYPYARSGPGLGQKAKSSAGLGQLGISTAVSLLAVGMSWWLGLGWAAVALAALVVPLTFGISQWAQSKIGGLTGDVYGAICELLELGCLLALVALVRGGISG